MMQIKCPHCPSISQIPESVVGKTVRCNSCGKVFRVEAQIAAQEIELESTSRPVSPGHCSHCGQAIKSNAKFCGFCGQGVGSNVLESTANPVQGLTAKYISRTRVIKLIGGLAALFAFAFLCMKLPHLISSTFDSYDKEQDRLLADKKAQNRAENEAANAKRVVESAKQSAEADVTKALEKQEQVKREEQSKTKLELLSKEKQRVAEQEKARAETEAKNTIEKNGRERMRSYALLWQKVQPFFDDGRLAPMKAGQVQLFERLKSLDDTEREIAKGLDDTDRALVKTVEAILYLKNAKYVECTKALQDADSCYSRLATGYAKQINHNMLVLARYNQRYVAMCQMRCYALQTIETPNNSNLITPSNLKSEAEMASSFYELFRKMKDEDEDQDWQQVVNPMLNASKILSDGLVNLANTHSVSPFTQRPLNEDASPTSLIIGCRLCNGTGIVTETRTTTTGGYWFNSSNNVEGAFKKIMPGGNGGSVFIKPHTSMSTESHYCSCARGQELQREKEQERVKSNAEELARLQKKQSELEKAVAIWKSRLVVAKSYTERARSELITAQNLPKGSATVGSGRIVFDNSQPIAIAQASIAKGLKDEHEATTKMNQAQSELQKIKQLEDSLANLAK